MALRCNKIMLHAIQSAPLRKIFALVESFKRLLFLLIFQL